MDLVALVTVLGVALIAMSAAPASACDIAVPEATISFTGTATTIDPAAGTTSFRVEEVHESEVLPGVKPESPSDGFLIPPASTAIVVDYGQDLVGMLTVGERYRVRAFAPSIANLRWYSHPLDYFYHGIGGSCGPRTVRAPTTYADGTEIENPIRNFVRRATAANPLLQGGVAIVVCLFFGAAIASRRRRSSRAASDIVDPSTDAPNLAG